MKTHFLLYRLLLFLTVCLSSATLLADDGNAINRPYAPDGIPFTITRENPNAETIAAMNEYYEMKAHPEKYKKYTSFRSAMNDVLGGKDA